MYAENPNRNQVRNTIKQHLLIKNNNKSNKTNISNTDHHENDKYDKYKLSSKKLWTKINEICPDCTNKEEIYNSVMQKYNQNKELLKNSVHNSFDSITAL